MCVCVCVCVCVCICMSVISVTVKHSRIPACVEEGRHTNPLYQYYYTYSVSPDKIAAPSRNHTFINSFSSHFLSFMQDWAGGSVFPHGFLLALYNECKKFQTWPPVLIALGMFKTAFVLMHNDSDCLKHGIETNVQIFPNRKRNFMKLHNKGGFLTYSK